jgi:hypothetical protein
MSSWPAWVLADTQLTQADCSFLSRASSACSPIVDVTGRAITAGVAEATDATIIVQQS